MIFISITSLRAQVEYLPGTVTDTAGNKINCLIRFADRRYNPVKVEYKLNEHDTVTYGSVDRIREFEITGKWRFLAETVKIDTSSSNFLGLSHQREPEWAFKKVFLKILVEGKASLYYFENDQFYRYFYSVDRSSIQQLVYKEYYATPTGDYISENNFFRQQLWTTVQCPGAEIKSVESLLYKTKELVSYFKAYNQCQDSEFHVYGEKKKVQRFFLAPTAGICYTNLKLHDDFWLHYTLQFDWKLTLLAGLDAEFILPLNRNKWGVVVAPEFQQYKADGMYANYHIDVTYQEIEFPAGIRYHIFLKKDMQISIDGFYVPELAININSSLSYNEVNVEFKPKPSMAFGAGYSFRHLTGELRYYLPKSINSEVPPYWISDYQKFGLMIRYVLW